MRRIMLSGLGMVAAIGLVMLPATAQAAALDLSTIPSNGEINGGLFSRTSLSGQGTGNFKSFLRVQANGTEKGYNTDGAIEFDTKSGIWTHSIKIGDVPLVNFMGVDYREILLDAGEPGQTQNTLTIDTFDLYLLGGPAITGYPASFPAADKKYSFVGDDQWDSILLDNIIGNGFSDMFALIPDSYFTGTNEYLYLYTELSSSGGTFEEFGVRATEGSNVVPEPATMLLFSSGLVGAFLRRKRA